jgi:predicted DNA-binding protein (MmcQ/YjbR family)
LDLEYLRDYCLKKKGVTEGLPFGEDTLVYKVMSKIFMITGFDVPLGMNLKCDPELGIELRERYEAVQPGYHMNKKHWNTIVLDGTIPPKEI